MSSSEKSNEFSERVRSDFSRARRKAFLNRVRSVLSGRPSTLLSYDEIKAQLPPAVPERSRT
jgi:hypothetical protein